MTTPPLKASHTGLKWTFVVLDANRAMTCCVRGCGSTTSQRGCRRLGRNCGVVRRLRGLCAHQPLCYFSGAHATKHHTERELAEFNSVHVTA
jgi:hypothetical protein